MVEWIYPVGDLLGERFAVFFARVDGKPYFFMPLYSSRKAIRIVSVFVSCKTSAHVSNRCTSASSILTTICARFACSSLGRPVRGLIFSPHFLHSNNNIMECRKSTLYLQKNKPKAIHNFSTGSRAALRTSCLPAHSLLPPAVPAPGPSV